ncbi:LytR/AlgR family response regulator transcription factor [Pedobacter duraquae]|uniref:LytTR family two component transcriptional regulator n=1 Tax=Pedobacter duraquae TaxID=425511 RepID=A0A4R6IG92_9SPHI|nr:LytTR family DNA-binding domain-containing protein [Pedobacter duraquae]TDO20781.1 LytTR family two component transcriptional regulator [Pedobacter duraquae]
MILNCITVDDEPLALGLISSFVNQTPFLYLAGSFSSGIKALEIINNQSVDVIFLDIQMPDLTGLQLAKILESMDQAKRPRVIFTTAYNTFAIEGYKVDALDYLLKPFDYSEFLMAATKAKNYAELLKQNHSNVTPHEEYIFLKVEYQLVKIALNDINVVEGLKDYVKVHLSNGKFILSLITMKALEEKLPAQRFIRVHRSFIIAIDKIESITKTSVLIAGTSINVGDQYKEKLKNILGNWF